MKKNTNNTPRHSLHAIQKMTVVVLLGLSTPSLVPNQKNNLLFPFWE